MVFIGTLCFVVIGISSLANIAEPLNPFNLIIGALIGLVYGWLFRLFLRSFINTFNRGYKKEFGKKNLKHAVDSSMVYLVPYTLMLALATFYMGWGATAAFVSAGLMTVGATASMEVGKLKGKQEIRNIVATTIVSFSFSTLWVIGQPFMFRVAPLAEGGFSLLRGFMNGGGL